VRDSKRAAAGQSIAYHPILPELSDGRRLLFPEARHGPRVAFSTARTEADAAVRGLDWAAQSPGKTSLEADSMIQLRTTTKAARRPRLRGIDLLNTPILNKGTAFTDKERTRLALAWWHPAPVE
jgi:hypothetical protein